MRLLKQIVDKLALCLEPFVAIDLRVSISVLLVQVNELRKASSSMCVYTLALCLAPLVAVDFRAFC